MIRKLSFAAAIFFLTVTTLCRPAAAEDVITLMLPESVIAKSVTALLPMRIDAHSKAVQGDIMIKSISDFQLSNNQLACRLRLAGNNLGLATEIAGH